ncbi:MAG: hypothetical protein VW378_05805, partial [bacterium]
INGSVSANTLHVSNGLTLTGNLLVNGDITIDGTFNASVPSVTIPSTNTLWGNESHKLPSLNRISNAEEAGAKVSALQLVHMMNFLEEEKGYIPLIYATKTENTYNASYTLPGKWKVYKDTQGSTYINPINLQAGSLVGSLTAQSNDSNANNYEQLTFNIGDTTQRIHQFEVKLIDEAYISMGVALDQMNSNDPNLPILETKYLLKLNPVTRIITIITQ